MMKCWQCEKFQSKNPFSGEQASMGGGFCRPVSYVTRFRAIRAESCESFKRREPDQERVIKKWLEKNGF